MDRVSHPGVDPWRLRFEECAELTRKIVCHMMYTREANCCHGGSIGLFVEGSERAAT